MKRISKKLFLSILTLILLSANGLAQSNFFSVLITRNSTVIEESDSPYRSQMQIYLTFQDSLTEKKPMYSLLYFTANLNSDESAFHFSSTDSLDEQFVNFLDLIHTFSVRNPRTDIKSEVDRISDLSPADTKALVPVVFDSLIVRQIIETYETRNKISFKSIPQFHYNFFDGSDFIFKPTDLTIKNQDSVDVEKISYTLKPNKIHDVNFGEYTGGFTHENEGNDLTLFVRRSNGKISSLKWVQEYNVSGFFGSNEIEAFNFSDSGTVSIELFIYENGESSQ